MYNDVMKIKNYTYQPSLHEVAAAFGDKPACDAIKLTIYEHDAHIIMYQKFKRDLEEICYSAKGMNHKKKQDIYNDLAYFFTELPIAGMTGHINRLKKILEIQKMSRKRTDNPNRVDEHMIALAKQHPISDIITFDSANFASCVWHKERSGSLKYYPDSNTVYCFGCHKYGDSIEIHRRLYDVDFLTAVRELQGHGNYQRN